MRITVSVCRKEGRPDYGSEGASCEISFEVADDSPAAEVAAARAYWSAWCRAAVDADLAAARPAPAPRAEAPPAKERRDWQTADHGEAARRTDGRTGRRAAKDDDDDAPRTGRALMAKLKDFDERNDAQVFKHVAAYMKRRGNDARMVDWGKADVADAWEEAVRKIGEYRDSDRFQDALSN